MESNKMKKVTKVFKKMCNTDPMIWGYVMLNNTPNLK